MDVPKVGRLLETIRVLAPCMTEEEISDIAKILLKVTNRLLKDESEEN